MIENFHKENSRWFVKPKSAHFNPACESGCCESLVLVFQWLSCLHTFSGYGKCNWPHCDSPFSSLPGRETSLSALRLAAPSLWNLSFNIQPAEAVPEPPCPLPPPASSLLPSLSSITFRTKWASMGVADSESTLFRSSRNIFLPQSPIVKNTQAAILKVMPYFCLAMSLHRTSLLPSQDLCLNYLLLFPLPLLANPIIMLMLFKIYFIILIVYFGVWLWACAHTPQCWFGAPRTIYRSQFSSSTVRIPGFELWSSGLAASTFTCWTISPAMCTDILKTSFILEKY